MHATLLLENTTWNISCRVGGECYSGCLMNSVRRCSELDLLKVEIQADFCEHGNEI